jgi:hypothetical protein
MVKIPTFKEYYEENKREEFGSIYNLIVIMKYLEKYEGYDFSKPPVAKPKESKKKKYLMKSDEGKEYYL